MSPGVSGGRSTEHEVYPDLRSRAELWFVTSHSMGVMPNLGSEIVFDELDLIDHLETNRVLLSARNCKCKPRCIKCNGSHETRMCNIKTKIENPVCINCKEIGHLASWKGCPKYPVIKNNTPPTYAQKLKSNLQKPNYTPTPPMNNPTPQIDNDTYEKFIKNMNALRIINDAFNKFPNLIEISEKIKIAKTDMEIVGLLLKIFKN
ncbi:hypothetical protein AVEN_106622-1 [Araneus ventricosus]|uniref:Pre-C2HC domain-containing protein n=1 Tax=Araneus ventricosus TaxID=182803 RepID=A0A4Y2I4H5_ARAVE|nr:hypothetical protein AVEN_106622-1 [Araneus ventricosus]